MEGQITFDQLPCENTVHADGNSSGYCVILKINGRKFCCRGDYAQSSLNNFMQIMNAVKDVYGENLCEDSDNDDIVDALVGAENIIRALNCWGRNERMRRENDKT